MDINNVAENQPGNRVIPLTHWNKYHSWPPIGGLRHMVFFAEKTGFSKVIIRVGRRVLIDEKLWFEYLRSQKKEVK